MPMLEIVYTLFAYIIGIKFWWVLIPFFLLYFVFKSPKIPLVIMSPITWWLYVGTEFNFRNPYLKLGPLLYITSVLFGIIIAFLIYVFLQHKNKFKLHSVSDFIMSLLIYAVLIFLFKLIASLGGEWVITLRVILFTSLYYYSTAYVMICFDLRDNDKSNLFSRFLTLNSINACMLGSRATQLGPQGTSRFFSSTITDKEFRKTTLKLVVLYGLMRILSNFFYATIFTNQYETLSFLKLFNIDRFTTLPRFSTDHLELSGMMLKLVFVLKSFLWFFSKISILNFSMLLFWVVGIKIKLPINEPWKATSFTDFFRRNHVYVALFYRKFILPIVLKATSKISHKFTKKFMTSWVMIFLGASIYQTISHTYQLLLWDQKNLKNAFLLRIFSDFLLATTVSISLALENRKNENVSFIMVILYILWYSLLLSISGSNKLPGFSIEKYILFLGKLFVI